MNRPCFFYALPKEGIVSLSLDSIIDAYCQRHPDYEEVLHRYGTMNRICENFLEQHPFPPAKPSGIQPILISPETLTTKTEFTAFLREVDALANHGDSAGTILNWALGQENPLEKLQEFWASPESHSRQTAELLSLPPEDVSLFSILLLKPFYFRVREEFSPSIPNQPFCHVCGSLPHFARLEKEERRRFLACPVCETQWPFPRFLCPFCGVDSSEKSYFTIDTIRHLRVDVCAGCRTYIKTCLENELVDPIHPFLEDLVTPELDLTAADEGYRKVVGYFAHAHSQS
jgi:hypothetical protein